MKKYKKKMGISMILEDDLYAYEEEMNNQNVGDQRNGEKLEQRVAARRENLNA